MPRKKKEPEGKTIAIERLDYDEKVGIKRSRYFCTPTDAVEKLGLSPEWVAAHKGG